MEAHQIICLVLLIAIAAIIIVYKKKTTPTDVQKAEAKEFLDKISNRLLEVIANTIKSSDPTKYLDLIDFLSDIYQAIYDETWNEVEYLIEQDLGDNPNYAMLVKLIDRDTVENLVKQLIERDSIEAKLSAVFEEAFKAKLETMEEEDKKAAEIAEAYENGTVELDEVDHIAAENDVAESINIPVDEVPESAEYDVKNDDSVELLSEHTEEINIEEQKGE